MERNYQLPARYNKKDSLGKGAAGEVFKVKDAISGNIIALKILDNVKSNAAKTLVNEFKTLSSLDHINLVKVYNFGLLENSIPYFTMELVDGNDLGNFLSKKENLYLLPDILEQIIAALLYLHKRNILHGDIKPENIMITNNKTGQTSVKLLDFGLASASATARKSISGTPRFLAPEILKNTKYSESSDIYALGMTLIECITGREIPLASEIKDKFYEESYKLLSKKLSSSGIKNAFSISSFILALCRIDPDERIPDSKEALQEMRLISNNKKNKQIKLTENILVGRNKELQIISAFLIDNNSLGKTIVLEGKRGVGKKKLIKEAVKKAQLAGHLVFDLSSELYSDKSFDRFIETLSENLPEKESKKLLTNHKKILSSISERKKNEKTTKEDSSVIIYDNIIQFIHKLSSKQPVLICIPDINHFNTDFLRFTNHLVYEIDFLRSKTRIIISKNTDISISRIQQETYQEIVALEPTSLLKVKPLSKTQVKQLVYELLGNNIFNDREITELYERTNGIPLFVIEILKHLVKESILENIEEKLHLDRISYRKYEIPKSLEDLSAISYQKLKRKEKDILQAIAIYNRRIHSNKLYTITENKPEIINTTIDILIEKGILNLSRGNLEFSNSIFKEFIRSNTSWKKRVNLNSLIAKILERDKTVNPVRLTKHFVSARMPDKAIEYGLLAAKELTERYEIYDCLDLLTQLNRLIIKKGNNKQLKSVLELLAPIELQAGLTRNSIKNYMKLIELAKNNSEKAEYYKQAGTIYSDYLGEKIRPKNLFYKALKYANFSKNNKLKIEILLKLSELSGEKRLKITKKAAKIAKNVDINTYAFAISKLLYQEKIGGEKEKINNLLNELLSLFNKVDIYTKKQILTHLSAFYFFSGNYNEAKQCLKTKLYLDKQTNDEINKINSLRMLGGIHYINGEFYKTIDILKEIIEVAGKYRAFLSLLNNISNKSLAYSCLAEYNKALSYLQEGERIIKKYKVKQVFHHFTGKFCLIYLTLGYETEKAFQIYYEKTKENATSFNNTIQFGHSQLFKTRFYFQRLQCGKTVKYIQKALKAFRKTNDRDDIVDALITLSMINLEENKTKEAAKHLKEARSIFDEIHCRYLEPSLLLAEGTLARRQQTQKAEKILSAGLKLSKKMGTRETTWQLYRQLALCYKANGEINKALSNYRDSVETIRQITESIDGDKLKTSYLSVPFRKRVFDEIKSLKKSI